MLRIWIALAVLATATHAEAEIYQLAEFGRSGAYLIDLTTLSRNGTIVDYQSSFISYKPEAIPGGDEFSYSIERSSVDCRQRRIRIRDASSYNDRGRLISAAPILPMWEKVVPGTDHEAVEKTVCRPASPKGILFTGDMHSVVGAVRAAYVAKER